MLNSAMGNIMDDDQKCNSVNKRESYNGISLLEQTGCDTRLIRNVARFTLFICTRVFELDVLIYSKIKCVHGTTIVFTAAH